MGYSIAWLAVRGISPEIAFERLALATTEQFADYAERDVSACVIPEGWTLVVARGCDHRIIAERQLKELSAECDLLACSIEEHMMYSSSEFWSRGQSEVFGRGPQIAPKKLLAARCGKVECGATEDRYYTGAQCPRQSVVLGDVIDIGESASGPTAVCTISRLRE